MDEDHFNRTIDEFEQAIDESMGYAKNDERINLRKPLLGSLHQRRTLILGGAGILLLVILIALFSRGSSELSKKDLTAISTRVDLLEERLTRLEEVELRIAALQKQGERLEQSMGDTDESVRSLTQRVDVLTQRLEMRGGETPLVAKGAEAPRGIAEKPVSPDKRLVHEVRRGENLYRIALKYGLSVDELCRINNITKSQVIRPGQKLIIAPKSK
jgi:LysM repeat protein